MPPTHGTGATGEAGDPLSIREGQAFTFGNWSVSKGWSIKADPYLGYQIKAW